MEEYTPSCLRDVSPKRLRVLYAIGVADEENPFGLGMTHSPVIDIKEMLETPGETNAYIIRLNMDGSHDALWRWNENKWLKIGD